MIQRYESLDLMAKLENGEWCKAEDIAPLEAFIQALSEQECDYTSAWDNNSFPCRSTPFTFSPEDACWPCRAWKLLNPEDKS